MNFTGVRVLVVGDVMLDHYIVSRVSRISPEAPVPVANVANKWAVPGGAANVARNLAGLGAAVDLVGLAGQDDAGENLRRELVGIGDGLVSSPARRSTCKTRILAQGQQLLRLDEEQTDPPRPDEYEDLCRKFLEFLPVCQVVVLSDYAKGVLAASPDNAGLCAFAIGRAREKNVPVLVDPKGGQWSRYAGAQCVTPNSAEFAVACGREATAEFDGPTREELASTLCGEYGFERLLLTRGARGMALFEPGVAPCYIRNVTREVADVSGAGDTVIASLAACVAKGLAWDEAARIANIAAGVAVGKVGAAPVSLAELNQALRDNSDNPKLYDTVDLLKKIEDWRRADESIVFTNGCFDLLHPGHISLIRQCAAQGDRVVVGLNSDVSVRRLKGSTRPIQNEQNRALLIAALQGVDAVALFDEDTPLDLIRDVKPDVLVKGSDYAEQNVVGADFVRSYGGRVYLASLTEGCSTTGLVRKMSN
jgi:D-beta-D-heptose 7-phosphate kinase/D-beta-D-heptose 1-phosphate adenosyltransferase